MKESRMDRIERETGELLQIIKEERAANAELQVSVEQDRKAEAIANAELRASIAELRESQKKTDEQLKKTIKNLIISVCSWVRWDLFRARSRKTCFTAM